MKSVETWWVILFCIKFTHSGMWLRKQPSNLHRDPTMSFEHRSSTNSLKIVVLGKCESAKMSHSEGKFSASCLLLVTSLHWSRSRIFLRRGCTTKKLLQPNLMFHIKCFFFYSHNSSYFRKQQVISGRDGCTPSAPLSPLELSMLHITRALKPV